MKTLIYSLIVTVAVIGYFGFSYAQDIKEIVNDKRPTILYEKTISGVVGYVYVSDVEVKNEVNEKIEKRTKNTQFFESDGKKTAKVFTGSPFYKTQDKWYHTEFATSTVKNYEKMTKKLSIDEAYAGSLSVFSGQGDGYVYNGYNNGWAVVHDGVTGNGSNYTANFGIAIYVNFTAPDLYRIYRSYIPFDTSALPVDSTISSSSAHFWNGNPATIDDDDGNDYLALVQTTQASSTILTTTDYNECGATSTPTEGTNRLDITDDITQDKYVTFNLNSDGLSWIKKAGEISSCGTDTGITCLGMREGHDFQNDPPDGANNVIIFYSSENTGTDKDPYLLIDYSEGETATGATFKAKGKFKADGILKIN